MSLGISRRKQDPGCSCQGLTCFIQASWEVVVFTMHILQLSGRVALCFYSLFFGLHGRISGMHDFWCECLWTGNTEKKMLWMLFSASKGNLLQKILNVPGTMGCIMPSVCKKWCRRAEEYYPPALLTRLPQVWRGPAMVCHVAKCGVACFEKHQDGGLPKTGIKTYVICMKII